MESQRGALSGEQNEQHPLHRALVEALEPLCTADKRDRILALAALAQGDELPVDVFAFSDYVRGPLARAIAEVLGGAAAQTVVGFLAPILVTASSGASRQPRRSQPKQRSAPLVLVVDSDDGTRAQIEATLQHEGMATVPCVDAMTAIAQCGNELPDVVVTALDMPGVNGAQLAAMLHRSYRNSAPPIVVVTNDPGRTRHAKGVTTTVLAPVLPDELVVAVGYCLQMAGSGR